MKQPKIVVIGGGTGSFTLLQALKAHTSELTALVNMADDGGSTGVMIDELGVLPPGDVRQCLVALSQAPEEVRELFTFRFPSGTFGGHSFGNIFLSAVEKMTDNFSDAVRMAGDVLQIRGQVLPITLNQCQLVMKHSDQTVIGQRRIEESSIPPHSHPDFSFSAPATITSEAVQAISDANLVVIAPGALYGSLIPALLVEGVADALHMTSAQVVYVCNLVNKPRQTADFTIHEYAQEIERFIGKGTLDVVLYNIDHPSSALLKRYAVDGEYPVTVDETALEAAHYKALPGNFLSHAKQARNKNDSFIQRSLIRHDGEAIAQALVDLL